MNSALPSRKGIPLWKICLWVMLLCPATAIAAGMIHPVRVWAVGGQWCQVLSPQGKFQILYGYRCDQTPVGLVRRFH